MFVQYSFVQPRREPMMGEERRPLAMNPSLVVVAGICGMAATACAFLWS